MKALFPEVRALAARDALEDARRLIREAQGMRYAEARAIHLEQARAIIAGARKMYAEAMAEMAKARGLSHHYCEVGDAATFAATGHGRYRALVRFDNGRSLWRSARTYGRRQSAQRAAARHIERLALSAACAGVTP